MPLRRVIARLGKDLCGRCSPGAQSVHRKRAPWSQGCFGGCGPLDDWLNRAGRQSDWGVGGNGAQSGGFSRCGFNRHEIWDGVHQRPRPERPEVDRVQC